MTALAAPQNKVASIVYLSCAGMRTVMAILTSFIGVRTTCFLINYARLSKILQQYRLPPAA
jgi:hypothetical protein